MHVCVLCVCSVSGGQKELEPLELDLPMVVSHHVGAESQTQVLWQSSLYFEPSITSPAPKAFLMY